MHTSLHRVASGPTAANPSRRLERLNSRCCEGQSARIAEVAGGPGTILTLIAVEPRVGEMAAAIHELRLPARGRSVSISADRDWSEVDNRLIQPNIIHTRNKPSRLAAATVAIVAVVLAVSAPAHSREHHVECPREAPAPWTVQQPAPLEQATVLFQPVAQAIDENAPPSLVPDRGFAHGGVWHNIWRMGDEPRWSHFVDCRYRGSQRVLRLKADGLGQCEQTAQPYSITTGVARDATQTMTCR
jgi:hypothetical protein